MWDSADSQRARPELGPVRQRRGPLVAVVDNYDSFTHNIVHVLEQNGARCRVYQNDQVTAQHLLASSAQGFLISAGPCTPIDSGVSRDLARQLLSQSRRPARPLLGLCLGHQVIAHVVGAKHIRAQRPVHGKLTNVVHDGRGVFSGLPNPLAATRYNSLVVDLATLPPQLQPCAWSEDGELMGFRHTRLPVQGIQFHPESILSAVGPSLLVSWLAELGGDAHRRQTAAAAACAASAGRAR